MRGSLPLNLGIFKGGCLFDSKRVAPKEKGKRKEQWMKAEMMDLMEERRKAKDKDRINYDFLHSDTKK